MLRSDQTLTESTVAPPQPTINHVKTPLIIITLSMPPEAETLVPKDIKRYPRKPPPFCQQYLTITSKMMEQRKSNLPEIHIQGVEIIDGKGQQRVYFENITKTDDESLYVDYPIDCTTSELFGLSRELFMNLDGYEMDNYGHLPGDTRTPSPMPEGYRPLCVQKRTPSPSTGQVIRVDVNINRKGSK